MRRMRMNMGPLKGKVVKMYDHEAAQAEVNGLAEPVEEAEAATDPGTDEPLPEDFPGRAALIADEIQTIAAVRSVEDLTSIKGIGDTTAKAITEALAELA